LDHFVELNISAGLLPDPVALSMRYPDQPAGEPRVIADRIELAVQDCEYVLEDIICIGVAKPVSARDRIHEPTVSIDQLVPGALASIEAGLD
jgi:hypothetical protein